MWGNVLSGKYAAARAMLAEKYRPKTYWDLLCQQYPQRVQPNGQLNWYLRKNDLGHLAVTLPGLPELDLYDVAFEHGPAQLTVLPILREHVRRRQAMMQEVVTKVRYCGKFLGNAYASKADDSFEVVAAALSMEDPFGGHYEISSPTGVAAAYDMIREAQFPRGRLVICNGFFHPRYLLAIQALRRAGVSEVIPVLDKLMLLEYFMEDPGPEKWCLGARLRIRHGARSLEEAERYGDRFGMSLTDIFRVAELVKGSPNTELVLLHFHLGSQLEDPEEFLAGLLVGAEAYCRLWELCPTLRILDVGGGAPAADTLAGPPFDLEKVWRRFLVGLKELCARYRVPEPDLITEWGRNTVAASGINLMPIFAAYDHYYQVEGTMMGTLPDHWALGQLFEAVALHGFNHSWGDYHLAGLTCDGDDVLTAGEDPAGLVWRHEIRQWLDSWFFGTRIGKRGIPLPDMAVNSGQVLWVAILGVGAYQRQLALKAHCMLLAPPRVFYDFRDDRWVRWEAGPAQTRLDMLKEFGFE